jgi:hypothetical protein
MLRQCNAGDAQPGEDPIVACVGMGLPSEDLATEILVRILRGLHVDARHLTVEDLRALRYPRTAEPAIKAACLVTMTRSDQPNFGVRLVREMRREVPRAYVMALLLPGLLDEQDPSELREVVDGIANSYEDVALEMQAQASGIQAMSGADANPAFAASNSSSKSSS